MKHVYILRCGTPEHGTHSPAPGAKAVCGHVAPRGTSGGRYTAVDYQPQLTDVCPACLGHGRGIYLRIEDAALIAE